VTDIAALLQKIIDTKKITIIIEDGRAVVEESSVNAQHTVKCERCGKTFTKSKQESAERALRSHRYHCQRQIPTKKRGLIEEIEQMHRKNGAFNHE
jgi:hypothetical protein